MWFPAGWCLEPESNRHAAFQQAADFKSAVSTDFTIEARGHCEAKARRHGKTGSAAASGREGEDWRRDPESNRARRICNPLHNRFAIAPWAHRGEPFDKKGKRLLPFLCVNLERETRLELATSTLARLRSTN